jgi:hypothetical protein
MSEKPRRVLGPGARGDIDHPELVPATAERSSTPVAPPATRPQPDTDTKENSDGPTQR